LRKIEALKGELEALNKRGVKIRIAAPINKESQKIVKQLGKTAEVRHAEKIEARFCIVDNKDLMFMVMNDEEVHPTYDIGIWITTPYFASAMNKLFEQSWSQMQAADKVVPKQ